MQDTPRHSRTPGSFSGKLFILRLRFTRFLEKLLRRKPREIAAREYVEKHAERNDPESVLKTLDTFARKHRWMMNVGEAKGQILEQALETCQPALALELGAYCGYSAIIIGRHVSRKENGRLISIELSRRNTEVAKGIIEYAGLSPYVDVRQGILQDHIGSFNQPFDVVFLDHWKEEYLPDLKRLEEASLLHEGTVVIADNVAFLDVDDYLEYVRSNEHYISKFHPSTVEYQEHLADGVEVSVFRTTGQAGL